MRYFAYSTILDRAALDAWKMEHGYGAFRLPEGEIAEALDVELVYDFPSRFWGGRVAGLAPRAGSSVFGRLFEISDGEWPIIRHKEGAQTGMCEEMPLQVKIGSGVVDAVGFQTRAERRSDAGPVSARFVEALVRGAKSAGLPEEWIAKLLSA
jgi:hypothetical protein